MVCCLLAAFLCSVASMTCSVLLVAFFFLVAVKPFLNTFSLLCSNSSI